VPRNGTETMSLITVAMQSVDGQEGWGRDF